MSDHGTNTDWSGDTSSDYFTSLFEELLAWVREGEFDEARANINHIQACAIFKERREWQAEAVKLSAEQSSTIIQATRLADLIQLDSFPKSFWDADDVMPTGCFCMQTQQLVLSTPDHRGHHRRGG